MADGAVALRNAELVAFGFTRRVGMKAADDPLTAALRDSRAPVRLHRGQEPRPARRAGAAHHAGGEPGHDHRHRAPPALRGAAGLRRLRALLRRLSGEPGVRAGGRARPLPRPAPRSWCSATPTAACCRPWVGEIVTAASEIGVQLGIHAHNDTGCAVANTLAAVDAGAMHVQGTVNGYGERTGNAELISVVANLELKYGWPLLPAGSLREATRLAHADRRGDERAIQRSSALCWSVVVRPQGGTARQRDQGRSQPLPAHRPGAGRQRHADARLRHGGSGEHPDQG